MANNVIELERALLGAILINEKLFYKVKGQLDPQDFFDTKHELIFGAINQVYDQGIEDIELAPIVQHLSSQKKLAKAGGENYLAALIKEAGLASNIHKYIQAIAEKADLRKVKILLEKAKQKADKSTSAEDILDIIEQQVLNNARQTKIKEFVDAKTGIEEAIKALESRINGDNISGISTGFAQLDEITSGFQKGDLVILAARPSMGKTALALNLAANIARKNSVAFFSLEMPLIQLWNRILSAASYIPGNKIKDGKNLTSQETEKIYLAKDKLAQLNLYIDDTAGIKLPELVWKAKRLKKKEKLDAIFIDYLQLIVSANNRSSENRQAEVTVISRTLKKLARDLDVPVIALSQLSRRVEQRESKMPMMSDIRESGAIEQDADLIAFIYRDAYYNKEAKEDLAKVIIAKHRNGALGDVDFFFNASHGTFIEKGKE